MRDCTSTLPLESFVPEIVTIEVGKRVSFAGPEIDNGFVSAASSEGAGEGGVVAVGAEAWGAMTSSAAAGVAPQKVSASTTNKPAPRWRNERRWPCSSRSLTLDQFSKKSGPKSITSRHMLRNSQVVPWVIVRDR